MIRRKVLVGSLMALLTSCNGAGYLPGRPVSTFTLSDVTSAKALASAGGDTVGTACWGGMLPVAQQVQAGQTIGIATAIELYRVVLQGAQGPCAPIVLPILVKLGPLLGGLGAITALPYVAPLIP